MLSNMIDTWWQLAWLFNSTHRESINEKSAILYSFANVDHINTLSTD